MPTMSKISSPDEGACKREEEDNVIPFLCLASASLPPKSNDAQGNEEAARRLQEDSLEDKNNDDASDAGSDVAVASPVESRKKARQEPAAAAVSYCSNCAKSCDAPPSSKGADTYLSTRKDTPTYPKYKVKIVQLWDELWRKSVYGDDPDFEAVAQGLYDELSAEGDLYRGSPGGNSFHLATEKEAIEKIRQDLKRGKHDHKDSRFYKKGSSPGKEAKPVDDVASCNKAPKGSGDAKDAKEIERILFDGEAVGYKGELNENDQPHGFGTVTWDDGSEWTGTFIYGQRNAHGTYKFPNGDEYTGEFMGKRDRWWIKIPFAGRGTLKKASGTEFVGIWVRDDLPTGTIKYASDSVYNGKISNLHPHGHGTWTVGPNAFKGEWEEGDLHEGSVTYGNGNGYNGDLKNMVPHGRGKLTWTDGGSYEGEFKDGVGSGKGTYRYCAPKDVYVGDVAGDNENGYGTMTYANGDFYVGQWKDGNRHGHGKMTYANGDTFDGEWIKDEKHRAGELVPAKTPPAALPRGNGEARDYGEQASVSFHCTTCGKDFTFKNAQVAPAAFKNHTNACKRKHECNDEPQSTSDAVAKCDAPPNKSSPTTKKSGGSRVAKEFELVLVDGERFWYKGKLKNDKPHGEGTMIWDDKSEWTGTFFRGQRNSQGTLTHPDGEEYTGKFKGKLFHGKGVLKKRDADGSGWMEIEGQWERCEIKGKCKITYGDNTVYEGTIDQHDRPHGEGTYRNIIGDKLTGIWVHGVISKGTKKYSDGAEYEGELEDEEPHGRGKLTWTDGGSYEGDYKDGVGCGEGTFRYASSDVYVGDVSDDDENGNGTMTYANGDVYVGQWKDGDRHGHGKMTFVNGDTFDGEWIKDEEHGTGTLTKDGQVSTGMYENGKLVPAGVTDYPPAKRATDKSGEESSNGVGETPPEAESATKPPDAETTTPKAAGQRFGQQDILLSEDDFNSIMTNSFQQMDKSGKSPSEMALNIYRGFCSYLKKSGGSFKRKVARAFFLASNDEAQSIIHEFVSAQFEAAQNVQGSEEGAMANGGAVASTIHNGVEEGRKEEKSGAGQKTAVGNLPRAAPKPPAAKPATLNEQNSECGTKRAASDAESLASDKRQKPAHDVNGDSKSTTAGNSAGSAMKQDPADDASQLSHGSTLIKDEDEKKNNSSLFGNDDADESEKLVGEIASRYSAAEADNDADRLAFYDYLLKYFIAKGNIGMPERNIVVEAMKRYESMNEKVKGGGPALQWWKKQLAIIFNKCKEKLPLSSDGEQTGTNGLP